MWLVDGNYFSWLEILVEIVDKQSEGINYSAVDRQFGAIINSAAVTFYLCPGAYVHQFL